MPFETVAASALQTLPESGPEAIAPPELDADGQRAAGFLTESLSAPDNAPAVTDRLPASAGGLANMGDAIIRGMQAVGQHYQETTNGLHASIKESAASPLNIGGLLQIQARLIEVTMEVEVVSKGISKTTQHVDQLTKLQ